MKMTLREINDQIAFICNDGLYDEFNGEVSSAMLSDKERQERLMELQMKLEDKIENIGYVLMEQKADIETLDTEIKRLTAWKKRLTDRSTWLRGYCLAEMIRSGVEYVKGKFLKVSIGVSPVSVVADDVDEVDESFVVEERTVRVNRVAARQHFLRTGESVKGLRFERNKHLRIS